MLATLILNPSFAISRNFSLKWRVVLRLFWFVIVFSIFSFLLFYIFQINIEIKERYSVQDCEERVSKTIKENSDLETGSIQDNSLGKVSSLLGTLNFVETGSVSYIRLSGNQVVSTQTISNTK